MKAKDNQVFTAAMQFCRNFTEIIPEVVIYGYAKLLTLDEKQVRNFVPEEALDDFEKAHKWFENNKLDLNLIKSGLLLVISLIPREESMDSRIKFKSFLDEEEKMTGSEDILSKAVETAFIPFTSLFTEGNELQSVFAYQEELKQKSQNSKAEEDDSKKTEPKDSINDEPVNEEIKEVLEDIITAMRRKKSESSSNTDIESEEQNEKDSEVDRETKVRDLSDLSDRYRNLSAALLDVVKGQDQAVVRFIRGYNQGELLKQTEKGNHPRTYFFFFGPPGVGKTLLAETAAKTLRIPYKIFNMSEFSGNQSHEELIGISSFYNKAKEGTLVEFVRKNPESLLIFDEIEKAHINVIRQFLQILGAGRLHNVYRNEDTDFRNTTIIFTSNVGKELYADRSVNLTTLPEKVLIDAILREKNIYGEPALPPEICSRIASGNTVMFNHLSVRHLVELVRSSFDETVMRMKEEYGISITYSNELPLLFIYNRGGEIDARIASGQSRKFLKDEIYELMRQLDNNGTGRRDIKSIHIDIEWKGMDRELKRLFKDEDGSEVLILSDNKQIPEKLASKQFRIHIADKLDDANRLLKKDITAVFIDPFFGTGEDDATVLSISDYNTIGIKFFHELVETNAGIPVYMLEMNREFSDVDRRTFLQEGATGTVQVDPEHMPSFKRQFTQIMEELYMETESQNFSQRGWVIDFYTKQEITAKDGKLKILFYGLKKRRAVDVESRGSILSDEERPNIKFDDVIGANNAKEELRYFVKYLQNPKQFLINGGRPPKGVLLYGPPGTGKTMLAKAMAGESDVTFLQTSAAEFKNKYIGESEANIRRIFAKARLYAPSIIFIDEIDAIGKKRTGGENSSTTESMLNALLTEMDGFSSNDSKKPVFVLAATNYGVGSETDGISSLDEALIRRFDNKIYVDLPKEDERKTYIIRALKNKGIDSVSESMAQSIAERTTGKSLAILQNIIDLALRNAAKAEHKVEDSDFLTALEEYSYGEKKEHTPEYYRSVAVHEIGHAYLSYISGDKPSYITIESRGNFGGYMQHSNQEEVTSYTKEDLINRIRTSLAGRASEYVFYGKDKSLNTGASGDLEQATEWAWRMVCSYGMEDDQLVVLRKEEVLKSPLASDYVSRINEILKTEMNNTIKIIEENKDKIQELADVLVKENRLTGLQFDELMKK